MHMCYNVARLTFLIKRLFQQLMLLFIDILYTMLIEILIFNNYYKLVNFPYRIIRYY